MELSAKNTSLLFRASNRQLSERAKYTQSYVFIVASTTGVNKGRGMCYPVWWDDAYKRTLAANRKE